MSAVIHQVDLLVGKVNAHKSGSEAPVQEGTIRYSCVRDLALIGKILEMFKSPGFALEHWQRPRGLILRVVAKFSRDKAIYASRNRGIHEAYGHLWIWASTSVNEDVVAFHGFGQRGT